MIERPVNIMVHHHVMDVKVSFDAVYERSSRTIAGSLSFINLHVPVLSLSRSQSLFIYVFIFCPYFLLSPLKIGSPGVASLIKINETSVVSAG